VHDINEKLLGATQVEVTNDNPVEDVTLVATIVDQGASDGIEYKLNTGT
jgi:spore coat polysaccharide biosynthesis protein SpsF (cytidylyltransferase family)